MCGISGILEPGAWPEPNRLTDLARAMSEVLGHRGPDDRGVFVDPEAGLGLGHRRLSIIDPGPTGAQPMAGPGNRLVLACNGEVYNFQDLRRDLEQAPNALSRPWQGRSDTEVMLAAFAAWGVRRSLARFRGMFALALWDAGERVLYLARDRMGEKPLYYGLTPAGLVFGSELKALRAHPGFKTQINARAVGLYLNRGCVPAPHCIYEQAFKLPPGCLLRVRAADHGVSVSGPEAYWSVARAAEAGLAEPFEGDEKQAAERMEALLLDAVKGQMISDAPLGALLSGGLDSSLVTALMQAQSSRPVRTFSIGFRESAFDEARDAAGVAGHLGTEHTELLADPARALDLIPNLPRIYDEPFSDPSQLPTLLVCGLAREQVTVCLTGDGGDEVFAGYNRHFWGARIWSLVRPWPRPVRRALAGCLRALPPRGWDRLNDLFGALLPAGLRQRLAGDKAHKLAAALSAPDLARFYSGLASVWPDPRALLTRETDMDEPGTPPAGLDPTKWMQFMDQTGYLPDDILVKVDRAAMSFGLETRTPYLDHRVVELAWRLPTAMSTAPGRGKRVLRRILYKYVPRELVDRPKMGFGAPLCEWLRGPLRGWALGLLDKKRIRAQGLIRPGPVIRELAEHLSGRRDNQHRLWNLLMLQAWLEEHG
ncbi:MAG: asparagine synthase (glutamine-hydrolyzing) [Desulfovibrionaceae bacterium]|nr:asparagine synthase (glutamine-hydrolyzing) [Desulfovibrionaceae bacterium]